MSITKPYTGAITILPPRCPHCGDYAYSIADGPAHECEGMRKARQEVEVQRAIDILTARGYTVIKPGGAA